MKQVKVSEKLSDRITALRTSHSVGQAELDAGILDILHELALRVERLEARQAPAELDATEDAEEEAELDAGDLDEEGPDE